MKNLIIIASLFFMLSLYGQTEKITTFGIKAGLNKSYIVSENKDFYTGLELYVGFFSDAKLNNKLNLQNEIVFSYTDDYHFIEIPVLIKYKIKKKWSFFLGPKLDFILDNDNDPFEAIAYRFKNFGISVTLGIQYDISKRFFSEIRYGHSFTAQVDDLILELFNSKRRTVRVGFGFKF